MVDRLSPTSRQDTLQKVKKSSELAYSGQGFPQVLIFPEGCTTNGKCVITFKHGAFSPGLPVQPIAIRFPYKHFDPTW